MARTANTTPFAHRNGAYNHTPECPRSAPAVFAFRNSCACPPNRDAHTLRDLRYSRAALAVTDARPVPEATVHRMPRHVAEGRLLNVAETPISRYARADERRARAAARNETRAAVQVVNAHLRRSEGVEDLADVCAEVEIGPVRHRHNAIWRAW